MERPGACHFVLGMQRPNCVAIGLAMSFQPLVRLAFIQWCEHAELIRPIQLRENVAERCGPDPAPPPRGPRFAFQSTRANAHRKKLPACLHKRQFTLHFCVRQLWSSKLENTNEIPQKSVEPLPDKSRPLESRWWWRNTAPSQPTRYRRTTWKVGDVIVRWQPPMSLPRARGRASPVSPARPSFPSVRFQRHAKILSHSPSPIGRVTLQVNTPQLNREMKE